MLRALSGALFCVSTATVSAAGSPVRDQIAPHPTSGNVAVGARRPAPSRVRSSIKAPPGCSSAGPSSFVGGGYANVSGGQYTGVLEGADNEACDSATAILGGAANVIGGDTASPYAVIVGGYKGAVELAAYGFIGGGFANALGYDGIGTNYPNANNAGIASGQQNTVESPLSFIGGGYANTIDAFLYDVATNGQSAFIGAGEYNSVGGNFSGVVSGAGNIANADYSTVVGGSSNEIYNAATQGVVGSPYSFIGGGASNVMYASLEPKTLGYNVIVGGLTNVINGDNGNNAAYNVISGGYANTVGNGSPGSVDSGYAVIGGGSGNGTNGDYVTVAGGNGNAATATSAAVGGGTQNVVSGTYGVIPGGYQNVAKGNYSTVSGGHNNSASGLTAIVLGGFNNVASGQNGTVVGGAYNVAAGRDSLAAGKSSLAANDGSFVWSDYASGAKQLSSTASNQFLARASGGFYLYSSANLSTGVSVAPGSGSWSTLSDRNVKTAIEGVDDARILAKVATLPVSEWSYTAQGTGVRHLGPMAQDFRAAFGLGEDARHISAVDEDGVALAAIKALASEVRAKDAELSALRVAHEREVSARRVADGKLAALEGRLDALEARVSAR